MPATLRADVAAAAVAPVRQRRGRLAAEAGRGPRESRSLELHGAGCRADAGGDGPRRAGATTEPARAALPAAPLDRDALLLTLTAAVDLGPGRSTSQQEEEADPQCGPRRRH